MTPMSPILSITDALKILCLLIPFKANQEGITSTILHLTSRRNSAKHEVYVHIMIKTRLSLALFSYRQVTCCIWLSATRAAQCQDLTLNG